MPFVLVYYKYYFYIMKTKQILGITIGVWMILFLSVSAQEPLDAFPQTKEQIQAYFDARSAEFSVEVQEKQKEISSQFQVSTDISPGQVILRDKIAEVLGRVFERFEAVIVRFDGIVQRINVRIEKLEEQGTDTEQVKLSLQEAQIEIKKSIILILAIQTELKLAISQGTSREQIKNMVDTCKDSLKTTQTALERVVEGLKNISEEEDISLEQ